MTDYSTDTALLDIVDAHDQIIGQGTRAEIHSQHLFHRAVHVFVLREDGALYLQKRSSHKDSSPNRWDSSCSGHVDTGETYQQAAVRELAEELDITVRPEELEELQYFEAAGETDQEFVTLYRLRWAGPIQPNPQEISEGNWFFPFQIDAWCEEHPEEMAGSFIYIWTAYRGD